MSEMEDRLKVLTGDEMLHLLMHVIGVGTIEECMETTLRFQKEEYDEPIRCFMCDSIARKLNIEV